MDWPKLLDKITLPVSIVLTISLLVGAYFLLRSTSSTPTASANNTDKIVVDVAGAVNKPGVYQFTSDQIVEDAITAAGGLTDQADLALIAKIINRASILQNNGKVYVPIKGDTSYTVANNSSSGGSSSNTTSPTGPININTASASELDKLPGIGPVIAGRIIDYRQKNNGFKRKEDLTKVSGIGSSLYAKIKDLVII